jgi:putative phosphoribosyl transferase
MSGVERRFRDRADAGEFLADRLRSYAGRDDVVVFALPRGGVPVAFPVARALRAPLDVFVVRKLGVPGHEELGMGAVATGGVRVLNEDLLANLGISRQSVEAVTAAELVELDRRERAYRNGGTPIPVEGRTVILVDAGLATGSTMRAALRAVRRQGAARVVVAVPAAPASTCDDLAREADEVVCATTPALFHAVGQVYDDFTQTTDDEVRALLVRAAEARGLG